MTKSTSVYEFIIGDLADWSAVKNSLIACSRGKAADVIFIAGAELLPEADDAIGVVVYTIKGNGKYVLQIYSKNLIKIPSDALAMHLAVSAKTRVLSGNESQDSSAYIEYRQDGTLYDVKVDIDKLDKEDYLVYKMAAQQGGAPNSLTDADDR